MLQRLVIRWAVLTVAFAVAVQIVPGIAVDGGFGQLVGVAAIYGLVNASIGLILKIIALPITILTLGLFAIIVNAVLLMITAGLTDWLDVDSFGHAILAGIVISIVTILLNLVIPNRVRR